MKGERVDAEDAGRSGDLSAGEPAKEGRVAGRMGLR